MVYGEGFSTIDIKHMVLEYYKHVSLGDTTLLDSLYSKGGSTIYSDGEN